MTGRWFARIAALLALLAVALVPAQFAPRAAAGDFELVVTVHGPGSGTVTSSPAGINCGSTCSYSFPAGTQVNLTASAAFDSCFAGWLSAVNGPCSFTGDLTVTMNQAESIDVFFVQRENLQVTAELAGSGAAGTVTATGPGVNLSVTAGQTAFASGNLAYGSTVTLTAAPSADSTFTWSGDCSGHGLTCALVMTKQEIITATFAETGKLEVRVTGRGSGRVTSNPAGITCPGTCSEPYGVGFPVTLTATPATGSYFAGWSLSEGCGDSATTCTFTMPSQDDLEVALFRLDHCLVPNVKRMPLAKARNRLVDYSCRMGKVTRAYSSRVKKGAVISEKQRVGSRLLRGAKVDLVISRGKRR